VLEALKPIVLLLHVLAAFAYVAGYVATNVLTDLARRTDDPAFRKEALRFSTRFDRLLNVPGGSLVAITGIATALVSGYSLLSGWVVVAIVRFALIIVTGIFFLGRVGRLENLALLTIIVLMVLRSS
jgi:uncharacterized membrane protein